MNPKQRREMCFLIGHRTDSPCQATDVELHDEALLILLREHDKRVRGMTTDPTLDQVQAVAEAIALKDGVPNLGRCSVLVSEQYRHVARAAIAAMHPTEPPA